LQEKEIREKTRAKKAKNQRKNTKAKEKGGRVKKMDSLEKKTGREIAKYDKCIWKQTYDRNIKGIGTTFNNETGIHVKCKYCDGLNPLMRCYCKEE